MVDPDTYSFVVCKTQGEGAPVDITNHLRATGDTYIDSTRRLSITRLADDGDGRRLSVVFISGMFLELTWYRQHGDVSAMLIEKYVAASQSRGIMGTTSQPPDTCKLYLCNMHLLRFCIKDLLYPVVLQGQ